MSVRASDYRQAGRYAVQDKRRRQERHAIEAAETAYQDAKTAHDEWADAYEGSLSASIAEPERKTLWAAVEQARDALYELDPGNWMFS